ncbi:MAG: YkvA family protein [Gemmatimonadota bacterium]
MPRVRIGRSRRRRQTARRTVVKLLRELPNLFRLLIRLIKDARVSRFDRILFGIVMLYVVTPADLLPDFLGFLGLADDLYLVGLALNRLFSHAGPQILLEHWEGNPRALGYLIEGVEEVGSLLPAKVRSALKGFV